MPTTLTQPVLLKEQLAVYLGRIHGRDRLDAELLRIASDVVGAYDREGLPQAQQQFLEETMAKAAQAAVEPALNTFLSELAAGLVEAPEELLEGVTRARMIRELGGD